MQKQTSRKTIIIAGAGGFIGREALEYLRTDYEIIALTRRPITNKQPIQGVEWRQCDLFSLSQTREALRGSQLALYLVHSMLPASQLTEASFSDLDYLAADNFALAAQENNLKQIIYIGGIVPSCNTISPHLSSRKEVEEVLAHHNVPVTTLRCGMVIGAGGSSLTMVAKLAARLPIMICPAWTLSESAPIGIGDLKYLIKYYFDNTSPNNRVFDVGGKTSLSYKDMLLKVASYFGKRPIIFNIPLFSPGLSCLWVSLITGAPRDLVAPLVESLRHSVLPDPAKAPQVPNWEPQDFDTILRSALDDSGATATPHVFKVPQSVWRNHTARSVQRLKLPPNWTVIDVTKAYLGWLPRVLKPLIRVKLEDQVYSLVFSCLPNWPLLRLALISEASHSYRAVLRILGGALVKNNSSSGRLEFRLTHDGRNVIAAVHDYEPALPWWLYRLTQAIIHSLIMKRFDVYLSQQQ